MRRTYCWWSPTRRRLRSSRGKKKPDLAPHRRCRRATRCSAWTASWTGASSRLRSRLRRCAPLGTVDLICPIRSLRVRAGWTGCGVLVWHVLHFAKDSGGNAQEAPVLDAARTPQARAGLLSFMRRGPLEDTQARMLLFIHVFLTCTTAPGCVHALHHGRGGQRPGCSHLTQACGHAGPLCLGARRLR
jgi:hypothetical protein